MVKIPNAIEARAIWNISDQQVKQMNKYFDTIYKNFNTKIDKFIQTVKMKDTVYGLYNYFNFSSRDEAYFVHMSLVRNDNIMTSISEGKVKYSYANAQVKYAMGFSAYGLQYIDDECRRIIRKKIRTPSDATFIDILFVMNSLLGLAFHDTRVFDIMHLTKSLAIDLDQILVVLSILKNGNLLFVKANDEPDNYEFSFNNYFEKYIKTKKNKSVKVTDNIDNIYHQMIEYFKSKSTFDDFKTIPRIDNMSPEISLTLRNMLAKDPNIAFRPNNSNCEHKIVYAYHYVDASKKLEAAANTVIYRFIEPKLSQQLINISRQFHHKMKTNIFDSLWILDYLYRTNSTKLNKTIFRSLGLTNYSHIQNNVYDLATLGCIDIISEYISQARSNFEVNINDAYRQINNVDTLNKLILQSLNKTITSSAKKIDNISYEKSTVEKAPIKTDVSSIKQNVSINTPIDNELQIYLDQYLKQINSLNTMNANLLIQLAKTRHELAQVKQSMRTTAIMIVDEKIQKISEALSANLNNIANLLYGSDNLNKFGIYRKQIFEDLHKENEELIAKITASI